MNLAFDIPLIAAILYVVCLISIPFQIKKYGKKEITDKKAFWPRQIGIFVSSAAIIVLCFFMYFGIAGHIALCACGVMGCFIATKEFADYPQNEE